MCYLVSCGFFSTIRESYHISHIPVRLLRKDQGLLNFPVTREIDITFTQSCYNDEPCMFVAFVLRYLKSAVRQIDAILIIVSVGCILRISFDNVAVHSPSVSYTSTSKSARSFVAGKCIVTWRPLIGPGVQVTWCEISHNQSCFCWSNIQHYVFNWSSIRYCVCVCMLDLSAAFDTFDHSVLLVTWGFGLGVGGAAWKWFTSYLSQRTQQVHI